MSDTGTNYMLGQLVALVSVALLVFILWTLTRWLAMRRQAKGYAQVHPLDGSSQTLV